MSNLKNNVPEEIFGQNVSFDNRSCFMELNLAPADQREAPSETNQNVTEIS
jgi:hypothetical protein